MAQRRGGEQPPSRGLHETGSPPVGGSGIFAGVRLGPVVGVEMSGESATPFWTNNGVEADGGLVLTSQAQIGGSCQLGSEGPSGCTPIASADLTPGTQTIFHGSRGRPTKIGVSVGLGLEVGIDQEAFRELWERVIARLKGGGDGR